MKPQHLVAKSMIQRLEKREGIRVDLVKFARLTLDKAMSRHETITGALGFKIRLEERYSLTICRASDAPVEGLAFTLTVKSFDGDDRREAKAFARRGREIARKISQTGLSVTHESVMGQLPGHTLNLFRFDLTTHYESYRMAVQPVLKMLLKPLEDGSPSLMREVFLSVTHEPVDAYARHILQDKPSREPLQPTPYF